MLPALAAEAVGPVDPLVCSIGPHARLVLPPSSVEVVPRSRERARDVVARMVESTVEKGLKSLQLTTNYLKKQARDKAITRVARAALLPAHSDGAILLPSPPVRAEVGTLRILPHLTPHVPMRSSLCVRRWLSRTGCRAYRPP